VWVEAEPAAMEKNGDPVFLKITETASISLDDLDLGVEPLGGRVRDAVAAVS